MQYDTQPTRNTSRRRRLGPAGQEGLVHLLGSHQKKACASTIPAQTSVLAPSHPHPHQKSRTLTLTVGIY
jgi:hypothetical protein